MKTNNDEGQEKLVPVNVPIGEITLPKVDVQGYIGKKVKISDVQTMKGEYGYLFRVQTEIVDTVEGGKKPITLRGSRIFGLQEDADGNIGWGAGTKADVFLKKMKAKTPGNLVGMTVVLQAQTSKNGTDFLSFN